MRNAKQLSLDHGFIKKSYSFGGSLLKKSNAKIRRPISHKLPMHIVLRSTKARSEKSFLHQRNSARVKKIIVQMARITNIQLLEFSNVGNHLHLLIKIKAGNQVQGKKQLNHFFRAVTGLIARQILKIERGASEFQSKSSSLKSKKFWDHRPFTRIVIGFRGYQVAKDYVIQNTLEALGIIPYRKRSNSS